MIEIEGKVHRMAAGQGIEVPPGSRHRFRNESGAEVVFLVIRSPKSHGDRVDVPGTTGQGASEASSKA